jgi:hypothetical protein
MRTIQKLRQGKASMVELQQTQASPEIEPEQRASSDLVKLILKLRWIGMEDEALMLQRSLRAMRSGATVLAGPVDTD